MIEMADRVNKIKGNSKSNISEQKEELDTDFLEFMGLPIADEESK